jgi:uncharacterized membrane protein
MINQTTDTTIGALYGAGITVLLTNPTLGLEVIAIGFAMTLITGYFRSKGVEVRGNLG